MEKVKNKKGVIRTYDSEGFLKRAACICVNDMETTVLLVSSRRNNCLWIVPGGGVEPDELPDVAAIREVREEAGVIGSLGRCLGVFENSERGHRTSVYVMVVTEELDEWEDSKTIGRKRKWFSVEEAVEQLAKHKPIQSSYVSLLLPHSDKFNDDSKSNDGSIHSNGKNENGDKTSLVSDNVVTGHRNSKVSISSPSSHRCEETNDEGAGIASCVCDTNNLDEPSDCNVVYNNTACSSTRSPEPSLQDAGE